MAANASTASRSDEELMYLVKLADDQEAFSCLYDRYAQKAFRVARSICANPARAEDAVQEGFLSIWRGRARFYSNPRGGTFGAWSMTIIRCAAIDAVRHEKARPRVTAEQSDTAAPHVPSPEDQALAHHAADGLRATLAGIPEAQAEVIQLAYFGELSHTEIAQQLDLPLGTVKGRMRLGLEKLRAVVDRDS